MFPFEPNEYLDHYPHIFVSDFQNNNNTSASSSSSSSTLSPNGFFNSSAEFHHVEMHRLQPQYHQHEVINHVPEAETHDLEKRVDDDDHHDQSLKFTLWKNENDQSEIKWMSSKMRLMRKMKGSDHGNIKFEDKKPQQQQQQQQQQASSYVINHDDHHQSSCMINNNGSHYDNHNPPIRVCADCNTTKTPLWRSGPKGPKSLCNACGIRQRKARRALAAAAENGKMAPAPAPEIAAPKIKVKNKVFKKRCRSPTGVIRAESSISNNAAAAAQKKKNSLEDFLFNLSKSLAFHRVFPQEETDAAILLMALSCSGVHG